MTSELYVIIVNYRTAELAAACLRSLAQEAAGALPALKALVVDNDSGDGSVESLSQRIEREGWQSWASVLPLERNGGFAFGNNAGIREALRRCARVEYLMLLNPDTVVRPGAIHALLQFMVANRRAGIAGSLLEDAAGEPAYSAHNAPSPLGELEAGARLGPLTRVLERYAVTPPPRALPHACGWVSGAALIMRRAVVEDVGLLDDGYFLYFEEVDYCSRARRAGWEVWFVPASRILHLEGASTGIRDLRRRRPRYWYDSRRRYFVKHHGVAGLLLADALWAFGRATLGFRRTLGLGRGGVNLDPQRFALDLLWGDLRALFNGELWNLRRARQRPASS
jgi:N-acetylglucosaminyl-diphospho-decaprenol L-rhamnosyltransferase